MKKRWFTSFSMVILTIILLSMTAFAAESGEKENNSYLYFVDGVQVDVEEYPNHEQLFNETSEQYQALASAVIENNWDYYIADTNGIRRVSEEEYRSIVGICSEIDTRSTGTWYLDNEIESGHTMYYWPKDSDKFDVASDEYIEIKIDVAKHARSFGVGYDGTSYQKEYISLPKDKGAIVAFIDEIEVPGRYRVFIENSGQSTETIIGHIAVKKR